MFSAGDFTEPSGEGDCWLSSSWELGSVGGRTSVFAQQLEHFLNLPIWLKSMRSCPPLRGLVEELGWLQAGLGKMCFFVVLGFFF